MREVVEVEGIDDPPMYNVYMYICVMCICVYTYVGNVCISYILHIQNA